MKARRKFSREFKQTAVRQLAGGKSAAEVARALEVHPSDLYRWRRELEEHGADQQVEKEVSTGTELSVAQMCTLSGFSRAGYYRSLTPAPKHSPEDLKLRDAIHNVALDWPVYGSRRMARELKKLGWKINRKRMQRLMREDNLLCLAKRKFVVTTDSAHPLPVYPNLPPTMEVTGINQLWIADITYIRLEEEFIYLAVILDAYSRRVIGWSLDDTMTESLTTAA
jgi:putative transposase